MVENERLRRKKQGSNSINPSLTNNATSNTSIHMKELHTSESHQIDNIVNKGKIKNSEFLGPIFETSTSTNSRAMKMNASKTSFGSPNKNDSKFSRAERKLVLPGNHNPKLGPGSYFQDDAKKLMKFARTSKNISALTTDGSTIGRSAHHRNQTENVKKRKSAK